MSLHNKKRKNPPKHDPSKVLLVCVYDTIVLEINNDIIYDKFRPFGTIRKVLIFQKSEVTKFFIEYEEVHQANNAKTGLDGTKLWGTICKMNIYFSNFSNVDLKNQTTEGANFSTQEHLNNHFVREYDLLTKSSQSEKELINDLIFQSFDSFSPFTRSKTDDPRHLQTTIATLGPFSADKHEHPISEEEEVDLDIKSHINSILESNSDSSQRGDSPEKSPEREIEPNSLDMKESLCEKESTGVKEAEDLHKNTTLCFPITHPLEVRQIYNLFSNFGNVAKISLKKTRAFVKFRTVEFAAIAFTYLNEHVLAGNLLRLEFPGSFEEAEPKENQYCECTHFDAAFDRFTPNKSITINSPSQTLHVSSLRKEVCREESLAEIFGEFGKVVGVQVLKQSGDKNMALVKFSRVEESFGAVAELHNASFSGRKMQISFTKSKV